MPPAPRGHTVRYMIWSDKRKADTGSGYVTWQETGGMGQKQAMAKDARTLATAVERAKTRGFPDAHSVSVFVKGDKYT